MQYRPRSRVPTRERHLARLGLLKRRVVTGSVLCFGALLGLTARHTLGFKHTVIRSAPAAPAPARAARPAAKPAFFDEHDAGAYSFADPEGGSESAPSAPAPSAPAPAPSAPAPAPSAPAPSAPAPAPAPAPEPPPIVQSSVS